MDKIKKIFKSIYLPFIFLAIVLICIHIPIEKFDDDLWFKNVLDNQGMFNYLKSRYYNWTSRVVIESALVMFSNTHVNLIIWKIINILMFELLVYSTFRIFIKDIKNSNNKLILTWLLVFGILSIPLNTLRDAGWIATTTNYLWTLSLGMFVFTLLRKSLDGEKIKWYDTTLYVLGTIYAANQEQMAAGLIGIFSLYFLYLLKNKELKTKLNKTTILVYILIILSFVFILMCPGNDARNQSEIKTWYPEYADFGFFSKVQLGITSMMKFLIIDGKVIFILLTFVMLYYIFKEYKNILLRISAVIPAFSSTFFCVFNKFLKGVLPSLENLINIYSKNELIINQNNISDLKLYIPILFYLIILLCILINIYFIFKNTNKLNLVVVIYGLGLATRLIMGFSPTVFSSGQRPSLILYFSFILITLLTFKRMMENDKNAFKIQCVYILSIILNLVCTIVF